MSDRSINPAGEGGREPTRTEPESVLHIVQATPGGVPEVVATLVADQRRRGWEVAVVAPPELGLDEPAAAVGAEYTPWHAGRGPGRALAREARELRSILGRKSADLVHLHSSKAGLLGRPLIRGRVPTVFQPHAWSVEALEGPSRQLAVRWERLAARWTDVIVCVSDDERERGKRLGIRARWAVVPNGIDLARYRPATDEDRSHARGALGLGHDPIALILGRLDVQKGQDAMLRAWPKVLERVPEAQLVLVGDGQLRRALESVGAERVRFAGWADDVRPWLAAADVLVMPSRWEAGLSLAAMEAMAMGRSIVATEVAGMGAIRDANCGAVVPVDDEPELAKAVAQRLVDRALARREGQAGRALVERSFAIEAASERMAALYAEVLSARRRA